MALGQRPKKIEELPRLAPPPLAVELPLRQDESFAVLPLRCRPRGEAFL
jgi:hypothetical protein